MKFLTPLSQRIVGYLRRYTFPYIVMLIAVMVVLSATNGAIPLIRLLALLLLGFSGAGRAPLYKQTW